MFPRFKVSMESTLFITIYRLCTISSSEINNIYEAIVGKGFGKVVQ